MRSTFPPKFKQTFAFQPFRLFCHSFRDNYNSVSLRLGLPVYKWSQYCLSRISEEDSSWQTAGSKHLNKGMLILSKLELPALPFVAPISAISQLPEYQLYCMYKIILWSCGKVICHSQKYTRDHWVMQREAL